MISGVWTVGFKWAGEDGTVDSEMEPGLMEADASRYDCIERGDG